MVLSEISNKDLIKKFNSSYDLKYEFEIFNRLRSCEFSDNETLLIVMLLIEKREIENKIYGGD